MGGTSTRPWTRTIRRIQVSQLSSSRVTQSCALCCGVVEAAPAVKKGDVGKLGKIFDEYVGMEIAVPFVLQ